MNQTWKQWILGILWLSISAFLIYFVMHYDFIPGRLGPKQVGWPSETTLVRNPHKTTVVMFLHPRCVCTKATVNQLIRAWKVHPGAELLLLAYVPKNPSNLKEWEEGESLQKIRQEIPDAHIIYDQEGGEALRFGGLTSGTLLVYNSKGEEIFRGGITDRRGGEENNPALQQFIQALTHETSYSQPMPSPVFGCPVVKP